MPLRPGRRRCDCAILQDTTPSPPRYAPTTHRSDDSGSQTRTSTGWCARRAALRFAVREAAYALVLAPLALMARLVFAVPYWLTDLVARRQPNREVRATSKVVAGAVSYSLWTLLLSAVAAWWAGRLAGALCLVALPVLGAFGLLAIERELDVMATCRSYLITRLTPGPIRRRLERRRDAIAAILDETYSWMQAGGRNP